MGTCIVPTCAHMLCMYMWMTFLMCPLQGHLRRWADVLMQTAQAKPARRGEVRAYAAACVCVCVCVYSHCIDDYVLSGGDSVSVDNEHVSHATSIHVQTV